MPSFRLKQASGHWWPARTFPLCNQFCGQPVNGRPISAFRSDFVFAGPSAGRGGRGFRPFGVSLRGSYWLSVEARELPGPGQPQHGKNPARPGKSSQRATATKGGHETIRKHTAETLSNTTHGAPQEGEDARHADGLAAETGPRRLIRNWETDRTNLDTIRESLPAAIAELVLQGQLA